MGNICCKKRGKNVPECTRVESRICTVKLPNGLEIDLPASKDTTAEEIKERCFEGRLNFDSVDTYEVVLISDRAEKIMDDDEELGDHLYNFDHIIIRKRPFGAAVNNDPQLDKSIKIK